MIPFEPTLRHLLLVFAAAAIACDIGGEEAPRTIEPGEVELRLPSGTGMPHLHATVDDRVLLTYLQEEARDRWALKLADRQSGGWSEPVTVASDRPFFANWADFPSAVEFEDGTLAVHWLEKVADAPYAYHVLLSLSRDGGDSWSDPIVPHEDRSPTEHGFVSMVPWEDGATLLWLDGREMLPHDEADGVSLELPPAPGDGGALRDELEGGSPEVGAMTLRARALSADGILGPELLLDGRTCECCQTSMARTSKGLVAAYRDRSEEEIRDISAVRFEDGRWSEPVSVHADGWEIPGCPVNGPQLAADGDLVALAWFTAAAGRPQVRLAFSEDGGASWGEPIRVDEGGPLGRVDVALLSDSSAVVTWIEVGDEEDDGATVLARRVSRGGVPGGAVAISQTRAERASGFPRMALADGELLLAWTLPGPGGGVRVRTIGIR